MKKADVSVSVTPFYQKLFVITLAGGWLVESGFVEWNLRHAAWTSGDIAFQVAQLGLPIIMFASALWLVSRGYAGWWRKLFVATIITAVGQSIANCIITAGNAWYFGVYLKGPGEAHSFNMYEWGQLLVTLGVFAGLLCWLHSRRKA